MKKNVFQLMCLSVFLLSSCSTTSVVNAPGPQSMYRDVREHHALNTGDVGMGSSNISEVCDTMVRDMLANPILVNRGAVPRIIVDSEYFYNDSSNVMDKNLITDKLRVELMRASQGRILFVGRHYSDMVSHERELKRDGAVQPGTLQAAPAQLGADFRLGGRIKSLDKVEQQSGARNRYTQITMEMVDLENAAIIWSNIYEFSKDGSGILPAYR